MTPQQNPEAELAVLGACLLSDTAIEDTRRIIEPADFAITHHQAIYAAILHVHDHGHRVDVVSVHQAIRNADVTREDLHRLQNDTSYTTSNAVKHATSVAAARCRFRLGETAAQIGDLATTPGLDAAEAVDQARQLLARVDMPAGRPAPAPDVVTYTGNVNDEYDWLIPQFLERRDRLMITGEEGAGKSYLTAQLATMAAAGVHPWKLTQVPPCNVLYIDLENANRLIARRLRNLVSRTGQGFNPQRLRIIDRAEGIDLTGRTDRNWLVAHCEANAAELLVIGPAYRMSAGVASRGDVGGEDQIRKVTAALDDVRTRCGVALIIETHAPHGEHGNRDLRPFGSSVWLRWPEFGVGIRRDRQNDNRFELGHWRGPRDIRPWPTALIKNAGPWPWTPEMPTGTFRGVA